MNVNENDALGVNRRDFLKSGSFATLMTMLGGVELLAETNSPTSGLTTIVLPKVKIGVIGLGAWGRELLNVLGRLEQADITAICDTYPPFLRRNASAAPGATATEDYKKILDNKDIKAVIIATPTHKHKDIVLAALQAGKHVYCEAPLANTIEDARIGSADVPSYLATSASQSARARRGPEARPCDTQHASAGAGCWRAAPQRGSS